MKTTYLALLVGLFLGTILAFGSFGLAGLAVGLYLEGRVDVHSILDRRKK